jgi:hypothetical protein
MYAVVCIMHSCHNSDAVNVHPFEFLCGEYNHLAALMVVSCWITPVHVGTAVVFIVAGGFMARSASFIKKLILHSADNNSQRTDTLLLEIMHHATVGISCVYS